MTSPTPRSVVEQIPAYKAGKPAASDAMKLSSNENPYPPLPGVIERATAELSRMNRYPDAGATALREALAKHLGAKHRGIGPEQIAPGTGSVSVLFALMQTYLDEGDEIIYAWRSFEAYPIGADLTGATSVRVPLNRDGEHDLEAMAAAITDRTRMILICTPNNPTGPIVKADALSEFLAKVPSDVVVVIDEAYVEFVRDPNAAAGLDFLAQHNNVVVLRTFSKAYGLAGLRVGFAIASEPIAEAIRKVIPPFSITDVATAAAIASIDSADELNARVDQVVAEREALRQGLIDLGWSVPEAQGNFVWLSLGNHSLNFAEACDPVSVRPFQGDGVRISVGEPGANARFLDAVAAWQNRGRK